MEQENKGTCTGLKALQNTEERIMHANADVKKEMHLVYPSLCSSIL